MRAVMMQAVPKRRQAGALSWWRARARPGARGWWRARAWWRSLGRAAAPLRPATVEATCAR
jgi:hypothetical protein